MSEDRDNRILELYRQSSQEMPPAYLDRAVMDMARKSVRRRLFSPFGNHWIAGGAMAGVAVLSVLLILTVPQQPDTYAPEQDAVVPSSEMLKEPARLETLSPELPAETKAKRQAPAAPESRFLFYKDLPDREVIVPEEEAREVMKQRPSTAAEKPANAAVPIPAESWYLQAGSFREQAKADELKAKLSGLGFKCEIQAVRVNQDIYHRVRVGPFTDPEALVLSRQKLDKLGFKTRSVNGRE